MDKKANFIGELHSILSKLSHDIYSLLIFIKKINTEDLKRLKSHYLKDPLLILFTFSPSLPLYTICVSIEPEAIHTCIGIDSGMDC